MHRLGRETLRELGVGEEPSMEIRLRNLEGFLELCYPRRQYEDEQDFGKFWESVCLFIEKMSLEQSL